MKLIKVGCPRRGVPRLGGAALALGLLFAAPAASASNPGDPLFCQPQEGTTFLIVNGGSGVFTADPDCFNNNIANNTAMTILTGRGGTLTGTNTPSGTNYVYTPPTPGFVGLDTFTIHVTTVWNASGGTGSAGGTTRPGGPADLAITLNVLPATTAIAAADGMVVPILPPPGAVTGCTATCNAGLGPAPGAVSGCTTGTMRGTILPAHGTLRQVGSTVTYTPVTGYVGTDTFTYQVTGVNCDGATALNSGDVTATVTAEGPLTVPTLSPGMLAALALALGGLSIWKMRG